MALTYYPKRGEVLICDYHGFKEPEMIKIRPVIVISPRFRGAGNLVTVVPLSTTQPDVIESFHVKIELAVPLPEPFASPVMWAKCDMINRFSISRLDRFKCPRKNRVAIRQYVSGQLNAEQLKMVQYGIINGLGIKI